MKQFTHILRKITGREYQIRKSWVENDDDGIPEKIRIPDINLVYFLDRAAERNKHCTAFIYFGASFTLEQVEIFCSGKLAKFKIPKEIEIKSVLPYNFLGKILKNKLRTSDSNE
ncbi:hypothetical protein JW935_12340 [candidate division KSB1 bacterium]|nr:hypothetical protein [candidate division KSB1 bacterium]